MAAGGAKRRTNNRQKNLTPCNSHTLTNRGFSTPLLKKVVKDLN